MFYIKYPVAVVEILLKVLVINPISLLQLVGESTIVVKKLLFVSINIIINQAFAGGATSVTECKSIGRQVCFTNYVVSLTKEQSGQPRCETKLTEAEALATCKAFEANLAKIKSEREWQNANEELVRQQTMELERVWNCTGKLKSKLRIRITTIKTPISPGSKDYKITYRRFGDLDFDCAGSPGSALFFLNPKGNSLTAKAQSTNCGGEGGGYLLLQLNMPMNGDQPATPITISGSVDGETYDLSSTNCQFEKSNLTIGSKDQPNSSNIKSDSFSSVDSGVK